MRQNTKRCPPDKHVPRPSEAARPAHGELDLGLSVSVYCAESGSPLLSEGAEDLPPAGSGTDVTEH